jgi:hypothetical protein
MTEPSRGLTIYFMDGKSMKLDFPKQTLNEWGAAIKIKEVLGQPHLLAEVDGMLLIFPFANIKYIAAYPAPSKLPEHTIKGATVAGG